MIKSILPGTKLNTISVFELSTGLKVYDKDSNKSGVVSSIKEAKDQGIDAYVRLEGADKEILADYLPNLVIID